ncbi:TPA: glycosyltransferase family 2 protein [Campylobacter jejuni]|nr:glycosyltransferase family 2 protein [Campylobacter jejuni]HDZ5091128.1 glycosyltransferase family 2 protein [Campylobacter jejuni]HDZ5092780.1 glycosyltransferase family 2 protein [Campylobacter jejuni]HDZ5101189.1 glycosyltransferase family 2 protein [Campylobacter jejuni]HDZ5107725.1 glycosyltransferase family 2 protein [Campylobacter jejuni]
MINNIPLVSIIIPIYNTEKYLRECLDSVVNQTLKEIEIILIDDGSTDNCRKICDEYAIKDERIIVIHKENAGLGAAYNSGLDIAKGEYVGFVESDDWIEPNMYEELYNKAKKTNVDVCIGNFYYYNNFGDKIYRQLFTTIPYGVVFSIENYPELLTLHSSLWSKIYRKSTLGHIRVPEYKNSGYYCDFPYWTEIACCAKKMTRINSCIYHYRIDNPNSSSTNLRTDSKLLTITSSIEEAKKIIKKYNKYNLLKEEVYFNSILTSFRFFANIDKQYKQEFFEKMKVFVEDLRFDNTFIFKYFLNNDFLGVYRKNFVLSLLNNDYKTAIKLSYYVNTNAVNRVKNQLSYQIGYILVHQTKTFKGILKLPYSIFKTIRIFKKRKKESEELPKLSEYPDYHEALKIQNHLSYKIGKVVIESNKKWYMGAPFILPFQIVKIFRQHKKDQQDKTIEQILIKLNNIEKKVLNLKTNIQAACIHPNIFTQYKNIFENQEIVIVGTGSSSNLYKNPIKNAIHVGLNRAFMLENIKLDYLFINNAIHPEGDLELRKFINNNPDCKIFLGLLPDRFLYSQSHYRHNPNLFSYLHVYPFVLEYIVDNVWAYDLAHEPIGDFKNVAFSALQFACFTNPSKIYLVGCDCSKGHFYSNDFHSEYDFNYITDTWRKVKILLDKFYPQIEIISINPIGLKGLFKDLIFQK